MKTLLAKVNPLQMALVVLLVALLSGLLPLADGVDLNTVVVAIVALIGAAKVMDELTARLLITELAKIDFADDRLDAFFDKLDMVVNAIEPQQGATVNINTAPITPKVDVQSSVLPPGVTMPTFPVGTVMDSKILADELQKIADYRGK